MTLLPRSLTAALGLLSLSCSQATAPSSSPAIASSPSENGSVEPAESSAARHDAPPARLVVLLVIDQLPTWSFERDLPLTRGGIARLVDEGVHYTQGEYPYAITFTAPGHAALGTGASPARTGIVANHWFDRALGRSLGAAEDDRHPAFAWIAPADGEPPTFQTGTQGASTHALLVEGVADVLERTTNGASKTIAIGLKERAAGLLLGQHPDLAIWFDDHNPAMTTSTAFVSAVPEWLTAFNASVDWPRRLQWTWDVNDPDALARHTGRPDDATGEGDGYGLGKTFPKHLAHAPKIGKAFRLTPLANEITVDTALAAIEAEDLGKDEVPDLLGITFSAHDYAGHAWGQESWERLDLFLRLDAEVGRLLDALDAKVGSGNYSVILTSDHGATPLVEKSVAEGHDARRVHHRDLHDAAEAALKTILGPGQWLQAIDASSLYLTEAFHGLPQAKRDRALEAALTALRRIPGLAEVQRADALEGDCEAREGLHALLCRSIHRERTGDIVFVAAEQCLATDSYTAGTGHGSAAHHDRRVPIVVRLPSSARARVEAPTSILRIAPTVAAMLGIEAPAAATEEPLDLGR